MVAVLQSWRKDKGSYKALIQGHAKMVLLKWSRATYLHTCHGRKSPTNINSSSSGKTSVLTTGVVLSTTFSPCLLLPRCLPCTFAPLSSNAGSHGDSPCFLLVVMLSLKKMSLQFGHWFWFFTLRFFSLMSFKAETFLCARLVMRFTDRSMWCSQKD